MSPVWKKGLETGFDRIDDQHKLIFKKLNEFHRACHEGLGKERVLDLFEFIERYVEKHFLLEETYMYGNRYPQIDAHKAEHEKLRNAYQAFKAAVTASGVTPEVARQADFFLDEWWREHICNIDKAMVRYVKRESKK